MNLATYVHTMGHQQVWLIRYCVFQQLPCPAAGWSQYQCLQWSHGDVLADWWRLCQHDAVPGAGYSTAWWTSTASSSCAVNAVKRARKERRVAHRRCASESYILLHDKAFSLPSCMWKWRRSAKKRRSSRQGGGRERHFTPSLHSRFWEMVSTPVDLSPSLRRCHHSSSAALTTR